MSETASLADYYFHDPRVVLIPIEQLSPGGLRPAMSELLQGRGGWSAATVALFDGGFRRYWDRTADLAARTSSWAPPRLRNVAVVRDPAALRPYAQMLNTSTWTVYQSDVDTEASEPELLAYVLVLGDRMAITGEVTLAPVHTAAYWFDRSDAECAAFAAAATRSTRPDAEAYRAVAGAIGWLRRLAHDRLRPPALRSGHIEIPGTGLLVPTPLEPEPPRLVETWRATAESALREFHAHWRPTDQNATRTVLDWLVAEAPPLLITARGNRILWDPESPDRLGSLRQELRTASGAAVRNVAADLEVVAEHTRRFLAAVREPSALPRPDPKTQQSGYVYTHVARGLIAYNLHEPGLERLLGPQIPYARAMLGARVIHEWCHLATDAGWVPPSVTEAELAARRAQLAAALDEGIASAPPEVRTSTAADIAALGSVDSSPGLALTEVITGRMPDFQSNLLAQRFLSTPERETYVRQNIRSLRAEYPSPQRWRMLARYLYEFQYLRFTAIADPVGFLVHSTWFDADFIASGILDLDRLRTLLDLTGALCDVYEIDGTKFTAPSE